jgi:hypothetical protein
MLKTVAVDALVAIELIPVFIRESLAEVSCTHVRVAHSWHYRIVTKVKFVILLEFFLHDVLIKDAFARPHNSVLEGKVLDCQQTSEQKNRPILPNAEFEWSIARRFLRS